MNWEFIAAITSREGKLYYDASTARKMYAELIEFSRSPYCPTRAIGALVFAELFIGRFLDLDETEQQEILQTLQKRDERYKDF